MDRGREWLVFKGQHKWLAKYHGVLEFNVCVYFDIKGLVCMWFSMFGNTLDF